jgi:hypothetical protein
VKRSIKELSMFFHAHACAGQMTTLEAYQNVTCVTLVPSILAYDRCAGKKKENRGSLEEYRGMPE